MKRNVTALDARRHLGELLESVYHRGDEVVIERAGKPMAVVIPAARYAAFGPSREPAAEATNTEATWRDRADRRLKRLEAHANLPSLDE